MRKCEGTRLVADPLRRKWLRLPLVAQQAVSDAFDLTYGVRSLAWVHIIPFIAGGEKPSNEQHGWLVERIVIAYEQYVEMSRPLACSPG